MARAFYGYMLVQTGGEWSAPLDDVFIHFDYARAASARLPVSMVGGQRLFERQHEPPLPFVLAAGYLGGFPRSKT